MLFCLLTYIVWFTAVSFTTVYYVFEQKLCVDLELFHGSMSSAVTSSDASLTITNHQNSATRKFNPPYLLPYWTICEAVLTASLLFISYMIFALTRYACIVCREPGNKLKRRRSVFLYYICLFCVVTALVRNIINHVIAFEGWRSDAVCKMGVQASYVFYAICLSAIFFFLWLRQNMFYTNALLSQLIHPIAMTVSWLTIFLILGGAIGLTLIYTVPAIMGWRYAASAKGCRDISDAERFVPRLLVYFTIVAHLALLALLVYPLWASSTRAYSYGNPVLQENFELSESKTTEYSIVGNLEKNIKYNKSEEKSQKM